MIRLPGQARRLSPDPHRRVGHPVAGGRPGPAAGRHLRPHREQRHLRRVRRRHELLGLLPRRGGLGPGPMWGFAQVEASEADGVEAGPGSSGTCRVLVADRRAGRRRRRTASSTAPPHRDRCPPPTTATWRAGSDPSTGRRRRRCRCCSPALLHLVPARRPARRRRAGRPAADRDLERLEQDRARGGVPAAAGGRASELIVGLTSPGARVRRRPRDLRPGGRPTTRSRRSGPAPRPSSTSPATATSGSRSTTTSPTTSSRASRSG